MDSWVFIHLETEQIRTYRCKKWHKSFKKNVPKIWSKALTLVLLRGVVPTSLTVFALVLIIAQPRGKIATGTFKFILSLHFSEKIPNLPPTPGVGWAFKVGRSGGLVRSRDFWIGYFENIWSGMHSQVCLQVRMAIFYYILQKIPWKSHVFTIFYAKINFCLYFTHKMAISQFSWARSHYDVIVTSYING